MQQRKRIKRWRKLPLFELNNNLNGVILWTNPSAAVEFTPQTVTLSDNISNYSYYEIEYARAYGTSSGRTVRYKTGKLPIAAMARLQLSTNYNFERVAFVPSGNTLEFGDTVYYTAYGSSATSVNNGVCIPTRVIGYKTL